MVGVLLQCNGRLLQPDQTSEFAEVLQKFADQVTVSNNGEMSDTDSAFQEKRPFSLASAPPGPPTLFAG